MHLISKLKAALSIITTMETASCLKELDRTTVETTSCLKELHKKSPNAMKVIESERK